MSHETRFSGADGGQEKKYTCPIQLTTIMIGNPEPPYPVELYSVIAFVMTKYT